MTSYISNVRFANNDETIWVKFDLWQGGEATAQVIAVNVASGNVYASQVDVLALRTAQRDAFVRRIVAQRRKEITARLRKQEEREAA